MLLLLMTLVTWGHALPPPDGGEAVHLVHTQSLNLLLEPQAFVATGFTTISVKINLPKLNFPTPKNATQLCPTTSAEMFKGLCEALNEIDTTSQAIVAELKAYFIRLDDLLLRRSRRAVIPLLGRFSRWFSGTVIEEDLNTVIERVNLIGRAVQNNTFRLESFQNVTHENFVALHSLSGKLDTNLQSLAAQVSSFAKEVEGRTFDSESVARRIIINQMLLTTR